MKHYISIDIGGSHMMSAVVSCPAGGSFDIGPAASVPVAPDAPASVFIGDLTRLISQTENSFEGPLSGIGIAIPGPFDYGRGICAIRGVKKFDTLFGLNLGEEIRKISDLPVSFVNDASAYGLGEYFSGSAAGAEKAVVLTLGTGLGSTYLSGGRLADGSSPGVPPNGYLYNVPFKGAAAEDYLSTRWFESKWRELNPANPMKGVKAVADRAREGDGDALKLLGEFADNLAELIKIYIAPFGAEKVVLGGNISRAADLFLTRVKQNLAAERVSADVVVSALWENAPLAGAAAYAGQELSETEGKSLEIRKTSQYLAPPKAGEEAKKEYDIYPAFPLGKDKIKEGPGELAGYVISRGNVVIDGYIGVPWDEIATELGKEFKKRGVNARIYSVDAAMHGPAEIRSMVEPYLGGDDPLFGRITDLELRDWFDQSKLEGIKPDGSADVNVLLGSGAALADWDCPVAYADMPKNELQFRARAGLVNNLGLDTPKNDQQTYKHFYFVDWIVLNRHKASLLPRIDLMIDAQRGAGEILMTSGNDLRKGLNDMAHNFIRVRPWFEPGAWGGQWMREKIGGLNKDVENLAWSFELMVLENGLMLESDGYRLEVSFDSLMYANYREVLGDCAERFGYDFPIRFDYLDTFDGGNLSIQCHPRPEYIRREFGMPFTQDETYYILDCQNAPLVYLGFQDNIEPEKFRAVLEKSRDEGTPLEITEYVQEHDAAKHDFFLIPNGTIHASGKDCMVLEISSAPYIFTFKMYDWVRPGLDGKPRPLNIERGMDNLYFDRKGDRVEKELICHPYMKERRPGVTVEHLPTHPEHFYDVYRYTIEGEMEIRTDDKCHVCVVVEGKAVEIETADGMRQRFNYAETFIIPAAAGSYRITNLYPGESVKLLRAFVK